MKKNLVIFTVTMLGLFAIETLIYPAAAAAEGYEEDLEDFEPFLLEQANEDSVKQANLPRVEYVLNRGVDDDLLKGCLSNNLAQVKDALKRGADVNKLDRDKTPLIHAVGNGSVEIVQLLLENGADPNRVGSCISGSRPLLNSSCYDLEQGKKVKGNPPLFWALGGVMNQVSFLKIIKLLLKKGADVNAINNAGETVLDVAKRSQEIFRTAISDQIVELLEVYNALDKVDVSGFPTKKPEIKDFEKRSEELLSNKLEELGFTEHVSGEMVEQAFEKARSEALLTKMLEELRATGQMSEEIVEKTRKQALAIAHEEFRNAENEAFEQARDEFEKAEREYYQRRVQEAYEKFLKGDEYPLQLLLFGEIYRKTPGLFPMIKKFFKTDEIFYSVLKNLAGDSKGYHRIADDIITKSRQRAKYFVPENNIMAKSQVQAKSSNPAPAVFRMRYWSGAFI